MSTVDSFEKCPQCESDQLFTSFQTRTMEDRRFCLTCGFRSWTTLVRDRTTDKPKLDKNNKWMFRYYERPGYGAYRVEFEDGSGAVGNFKQAPTDEQLKECIQDWKEFETAELLFLSRWLDEHLEIIIDTWELKHGC